MKTDANERNQTRWMKLLRGPLLVRSILFCFVLAVVLAMGGLLYGQTQNGNIVGTVKDPSGATAPGVNLTATQQQTGTTRTAVSGPDGGYRFALLPYGDYTITAEASGFKKLVNRDVHLQTNQTLRVDINLELGEITQQVGNPAAGFCQAPSRKPLQLGPNGGFLDHLGYRGVFHLLRCAGNPHGSDPRWNRV